VRVAKLLVFNIAYVGYSPISKLYQTDAYIVGFASKHFNGNLKYLYEEIDSNYKNIKIYFVTESAAELERLKEANVEAYNCRDIRKIPLFVKTKVWVTSHGPFYIPEYYLFSLSKKHKSKWVDLWHGIDILDGNGVGRAKMLKYYDVGLVSSEFLKNYYVSKEDDILSKLKLIGYPRTDPLVNNSNISREKIINELHIPSNKKNILYAPTWGKPTADEDETKPFFPFECDETILKDINEFCILNKCNFIIRMHTNWEQVRRKYAESIISHVEKIDNIFYSPFKNYPLTEPVLYVSDVLITDHSSIADDFILLDRPVIHLDVGVDTRRFTPGLGNKWGYIAKNKLEFFDMLQKALDSPEEYQAEFRQQRDEFIKKAHEYADGRSSQRCAEEIMKLLNER